MAVSWRVVTTNPNELQKTLEDFTNDRWRVMQVSPTPASKDQRDGLVSTGTFTVVGYRMTKENKKKDWREQDERYGNGEESNSES